MATDRHPTNTINQAKTASGINILAGIWLIIAPFVLGYSAVPESTWNDVIVGAAVIIVAAIKISKPLSAAGVSWINVLLGVWLIIAPFVLTYETTEALWNDIILGCIVAICGIWSAVAAREPTRDVRSDVPPRGTPAGTSR